MTASSPALHIFDCDGVLVDSEVLVTRIESQLLHDIGVELAPESIAEAFVGLTEAQTRHRIESEWRVAFPEDFAATKRAMIEEVFRAELRAVPGIERVLEAVPGPRCVASSSAPDRIRTSLAVTGLERFFGDHVFSATNVARGKPAPDLFLHAAAVMHAEPSRCVVIEDSPPGVAAGRAAGMQVIGFTGASHSGPALVEKLRTAGAHRVVPDADALFDALVPAA